jgi:hypothetical protein
LIWAAGADSTAAVPAEAALSISPPSLAEPLDANRPRAPVPEWVHELAEVLATGRDPAAMPNPPPTSWLSDVMPDEK